MGRQSTGIQTVSNAFVIDINDLQKSRVIKPGNFIKAELEWISKGGSKSSISIETSYKSIDAIFVVLSYIITKADGEKQGVNYTIRIQAIPSNLGKGSLLYFLCPQTGKRCRKLYLAYNSEIWKSRTAYKTRLYYPNQTCSKLDRHNSRYFELERKLESMPRLRSSNYKGLPTKRRLKTIAIYDQMDKLDHLRWSINALPKSLQKAMGMYKP